MASIFRYMRLTEFEFISKNSKLLVKYPGVWQDKLEDLFSKLLEDEDKVNRLVCAYAKSHNYSDFDLHTDITNICSLLFSVRCQCWTFTGDNVEYWQRYLDNEVVCVETDTSEIDECSSDLGPVWHNDIKYVPDLNEIILLDEFEKDRRLIQLVSLKDEMFSYEKEHRIIVTPSLNNIKLTPCSHLLSETSLSAALIKHAKNKKLEIGEETQYVKIPNTFIKSVMIHPLSTCEFSNTVEALCHNFLKDAVFHGKSKIYN